MFTFIDRLTVTGDPDEFERIIKQISAHMAGQPGFVSHRLYQSEVDLRVFVEVAEWADAAAHERATGTAGFRTLIKELMRHATADFAPFRLRPTASLADAKR